MDDRRIINIIREDQWMMEILRSAKSLNLPDWWICAGFVRSKIWDTLHEFSDRTLLPDIDVIYFDPKNNHESEEKKWEAQLSSLQPEIPWSVKNEARMHLKSNILPYSSSFDAISKFPETATSLGVKLDEADQLVLAAPHGVSDVLNLLVRPTPFFNESTERLEVYKERLAKKNWKATWSKLKIYEYSNS